MGGTYPSSMSLLTKINNTVERQGFSRVDLYNILVKKPVNTYREKAQRRVSKDVVCSDTYSRTLRRIENAGIRLLITYEKTIIPSKNISELKHLMESYEEKMFVATRQRIKHELYSSKTHRDEL